MAEIKTVVGESFELDYFSFGTGKRTMVILPGASVVSVMLSADAIAQAYACFADEFTVYVFDVKKDLRPGCDIYEMADAAAQAMKILGLENICLFGCSLGGMMAQTVAVRYPELIERLVLGSTMSRANTVSAALCDYWCALAEAGNVRGLNRAVFGRIYSHEYYEKYKEAFIAAENTGSREELSRFAVMVRAFRNFDILDELKNVKCRSLVIGTWDDHTLSGEAACETAAKLHCELYMYVGYGHAAYDEAPDYKDRLMKFFAE